MTEKEISKKRRRVENDESLDNPDFVEWLESNREVVWQNCDWICVTNVDHHKPDSGKPFLTIYHKHENRYWFDNLKTLTPMIRQYGSWEWVKRADHRKKINRVFFHVSMP